MRLSQAIKGLLIARSAEGHSTHSLGTDRRWEVLLPVCLDDYVLITWEQPSKSDLASKMVAGFRGWDRSTWVGGKLSP